MKDQALQIVASQKQEIDKLNHEILTDGEIQKRRGLLVYPSTRPLKSII